MRIARSRQTRGRPGMKDEPKRKSFIPWQILLIPGSGVVAMFIFALPSPSGLQTFVILFILSGAAFLVGALVGFLFGIPKSRTDGGRAPEFQRITASGLAERYWDNANLEEVSDWLTKIIVGLGLVEITRLGDLFGAMSGRFDPILGKSGTIVLQGSILFFLVFGFILCYIWTRVMFYGILTDVNVIRSQVMIETKEEVAKIENRRAEEFEITRTLNDFYVVLDVAKNAGQRERDWGVLNPLYARAVEIFNKDNLNRKAAISTNFWKRRRRRGKLTGISPMYYTIGPVRRYALGEARLIRGRSRSLEKTSTRGS